MKDTILLDKAAGLWAFYSYLSGKLFRSEIRMVSKLYCTSIFRVNDFITGHTFPITTNSSC